MRMVPRELVPGPGVTSSEIRVHEWLAAADLPGVALHSLNLPEHDYKLTAEIDFLLVTDQLVLVVEVKGARVAQIGGEWEYSDRRGHSRSSREGPFRQASSAMYALRRLLTERVGERRVSETAFGFLVVTPDVEVPASVEWSPESYVGRNGLSRAGGLRGAVLRASTYWRTKQPGRRSIAANERAELVNTLRPDFDKAPGLGARADALDTEYLRLTDEQFQRLDLISDNPRVLCSGGAGTGKTFLATEVARRKQRDGEQVLFTCFSGVMASFVEERLRGTGVIVESFDRAAVDGRVVTHLVVDEAQDLMNLDDLQVLDDVLTDGLERGSWSMFLDPNKQTNLHAAFEPAALELLESAGAVPARLKTNCRNTREIAFQTRAITGADMGVAAAGSGPQVEFVTVEDRDDETAKLEVHLRRLRDQDVRPEDITMISLRGEWSTSAATTLRDTRRGRIRRLDRAWAAGWPGATTSWTSVSDVKGLENRFVCVIDIDTLSSDDDLNRLYVALSRARAGLWVALSPALSEQVAELFRVHSPGAIDAFGAGR